MRYLDNHFNDGDFIIHRMDKALCVATYPKIQKPPITAHTCSGSYHDRNSAGADILWLLDFSPMVKHIWEINNLNVPVFIFKRTNFCIQSQIFIAIERTLSVHVHKRTSRLFCLKLSEWRSKGESFRYRGVDCPTKLAIEAHSIHFQSALPTVPCNKLSLYHGLYLCYLFYCYLYSGND